MNRGVREWLLGRRRRRSDAANDSAEYQDWIDHYDRISDQDRQQILDDIALFDRSPKITVVLLVRDADATDLESTVESVRRQIYRRWQLLVFDVSGEASLPATLGDDPRIEFAGESDPVRNRSAAALLQAASGEVVTFVECGDLLAETALYCLARLRLDHPGADLMYSDEDRVDRAGRRFRPYFKPDWSPDLILAFNYVGGLFACRLERVRRVGGFRSGSKDCLLHDLLLRCAEGLSRDRILHLPEILYHRRGKGALEGGEHDLVARQASIDATVETSELRPQVVAGKMAGTLRLRWPLSRPRPWVSVIIPTRNRHELLRSCLDSLRSRTDYDGFETVVVDNQSDDLECVAYLDSIRGMPGIRVISLDTPFNYSALNNLAVRESEGEILAFLNNDVEIADGDWLEEMVSHAMRPRVGAVGAKLCYSDGTIQHGGVVLGGGAKTDAVAAHLCWGLDRDDSGYFGAAQVVQNLSAVTAACMVMRREIFAGVGGFDEVNLEVAFNDVDLCLRLGELGYWIVWTPFAELIHHESRSRGSDQSRKNKARFAREVSYMRRRWSNRLDNDPFYSPNLDLVPPDWSLAFPPRRRRPWRGADS
ncbi:MAG: glycosyltransferase family 2 protein [Acidobacteriota bacterium]